MLLTNASGFHFCPTGDTVCGCPQFRGTDFHSKGTAMKISPLSDLASSTWGVLWRAQSLWRVLIQKTSALHVARLSTAQCQTWESHCAFNLKLRSVRNEQWQSWQLYGPFDLHLLARQHQLRVTLWFWFTHGSIWLQYLSSNQGTASHEGKFSSHNLNSTDFQVV